MTIEEEEKILEEMDKLSKKTNELAKQLVVVTEKRFEEDDSYIKIVCLNCDGVGWTRVNDKKKICELCKNKLYIWAKKFK